MGLYGLVNAVSVTSMSFLPEYNYLSVLKIKAREPFSAFRTLSCYLSQMIQEALNERHEK